MEIKLINQQKTFYIKGKRETVLVNPKEEEIKKIGARIVIYNETKDESLRAAGEVISIVGPGEYEIGGVEILGINGGEGVIYTVLMEGVTVALLAKLTETLSDKKIEKVAGADVLMVSLDNGQTIGFKAVVDLAKKWGVNYLIPVGSDPEMLKKFLDEVDSEGQEAVDSIKLDKDNLPDGMEVVVLKS